MPIRVRIISVTILIERQEMMQTMLYRAILGFITGALAVLTFHAATWEAFHLVGLMPAPYPMHTVPPFGVPQIVSLCFWGGLWGVIFGLILPVLPTSIPLWLKGLGLGMAAVLAGWFVVAPLKGLPLAGGWAPALMARSVAINGAWGIGVGILMSLVLRRPRRVA